MAAFAAAIDAGADGIEFDVRLSRDGVPVIIHDETLRRTAGVNKRVADLALAELQQIDVGKGQTVPSLRQLFELISAGDLILYLEIKSSAPEHLKLAEACCRLINEFSLAERVVVECFELAVLEIVKSIDAKIRTAAMFQAGARIVERALAAGATEVALHYRLVTKQLVEKAKEAGLGVVIWTVDDPAWLTRARALQIDALITNDPAAARERLKQSS